MVDIPHFQVEEAPDTLADNQVRRVLVRPASEPAFSQVIVDTLALGSLAGVLDESLDLSRTPAQGYYWIESIDNEAKKPRAIWYWHPDVPWAIYSEFFGRHDGWREPVQQVWLLEWHVVGSGAE